MDHAVCGIERHLLAKSMVHNGDPVLAWCASNTILAEDPAGNRKPDKKRSKDKIDAIVALGMAVARAAECVENDGPQIFL